MKYLASEVIPKDNRLALCGEADRGDGGKGVTLRGEGLGGGGDAFFDGREDFVRVLLVVAGENREREEEISKDSLIFA